MRVRRMLLLESRILFVHAALLSYAAVAIFPVILVAMNSIKNRKAIFAQPLALPTGDTFSLRGYQTVWSEAHFPRYFLNSAVVTISSLTLIMLFGAMAAYALTEFKFRGSRWLALYLTLGLMIPIRLGTVAILRLIQQLGLLNTLWALILVYVAMNLPIAILILSVFMRQVSADLKNAARIDGAGEYRIFRARNSNHTAGHRNRRGLHDDSGMERPLVSADLGAFR